MGRIAVILKKEKVSKPALNNRFTVELCENIHIHYRNLRLEFTKEEFLYILKLLKGINEHEVETFKYSNYAYKELVKEFGLPESVWYDDRLQIERQKEGHYHIHYRNLRLEFSSLKELGFSKFFGWWPKKKYALRKKIHEFRFKFIKLFWRKKSFAKAFAKKNKNNFYQIDKYVLDKLKDVKIYKCSVNKIKLKNLKVILFVKEGTHVYKLPQSPAYKFLEGDVQGYLDYNDFKNPKGGGDIHSIQRYSDLIKSFNENGYQEENVILVNDRNEIFDGQHRACLLRKKYGGNKKVKVIKFWFA